MKKIKMIALFSTALMLLSLAGCGDNKEEETATSITVATVQTGSVSSSITYTGTISAAADVAVTPKVSGRITGVNISLGQQVNAGDVLFTIEDTDLRLQVRQAQANLETAQAAYSATVGASAQQSETQARQALAQARQELSDAQTSYDMAVSRAETQSNVQSAKISLDQAQSAYDIAVENNNNNTIITAAQVALESAQTTLEQTQKLYEQGGATKQAVDQAQDAVKNAQAQYDSASTSARQALDTAKAQLDLAQQQYNDAVWSQNNNSELVSAKSRLENAKLTVASAEESYNLTVGVVNPSNRDSAAASVENARAALALAQESLNNATVRAPIRGQVSELSLHTGDMASPTSTRVQIVDPTSVQVEIKVAEKNINTVTVGMPAKVSVSSAEIEDFDAAVSEISPAADATGMFTVKINMDNTEGLFKAGMFADIRLISSITDDALTIPTDAILEEDGKNVVFVVNGDVLERREITTGMDQDDRIEVISGLSDGETVVVRGKDFVDESSKFKIIEDTTNQ